MGMGTDGWTSSDRKTPNSFKLKTLPKKRRKSRTGHVWMLKRSGSLTAVLEPFHSLKTMARKTAVCFI